MKRFWEKFPAAFEINGAGAAAGELNVWFWSPDASAMDLRHYDTIGHDGKISYEDHTDGFSTPTGVANTTEMTLWALPETPAQCRVARDGEDRERAAAAHLPVRNTITRRAHIRRLEPAGPLHA